MGTKDSVKTSRPAPKRGEKTAKQLKSMQTSTILKKGWRNGTVKKNTEKRGFLATRDWRC